uniref:Mediator of RNA polymerase II transcription subunit 30 n=1 Tax=Oncorhynchus mykiss TaxID=8022 RepID=A0A8C7PA24_ONCMY
MRQDRKRGSDTAIPLLQKGLGLAGMLPQQQQYHLPLGPVQLPMPPQGETIQDVITLTMEIFQITRATQLPNGVTQSQAVYQDRFGKLQEHLHPLALLLRKLRLLYERSVEMTSDLQEELPEVGRWSPARVEPCSPAVNPERQEVLEEIKILDQMRNLLWDVNALLTLRK